MSEKSPRDLEVAREFLAELATRLDLDPALMNQAMPHLLGMTKHVAHGVVRPAAPLAAFLVGYAAASETGPDAGEPSGRVLAALAQVEALISEYGEHTDGQA